MNNRQRTFILVGIVAFALTACAPAVAGLRTGEFAVQNYELLVEDAVVETHDQGYTVERDGLLLAVTMTNRSFDVVLMNRGSEQVVFSVDQSAASVRGLSTRVLPGGTSWINKDSPKPDTIVLPGASAIETLYLDSHIYYSSGIKVRPFLDGTTEQVGDIVLSLALTVDGEPAPLVLRFTPSGRVSN